MAIEEMMVPSPWSKHDVPRFDLIVYAARAVQQLDASMRRVTFLIKLADLKVSSTGAQDIQKLNSLHWNSLSWKERIVCLRWFFLLKAVLKLQLHCCFVCFQRAVGFCFYWGNEQGG